MTGRRVAHRDLGHHRPRMTADGLLLGTRAAVARYTHRHENLVRRHCVPVACDVRTRALLFDMDEASALLGRLVRRVA